MRRSALIALPVLAALVVAVFQGCGSTSPKARTVTSQPALSATVSTQPESTAPPVPFQQETFTNRRTINYVASDPPNNALLAAPPEAVVISFSKGLAAGSFIEVTREGIPVVTGPVVVEQDTRSMSAPITARVTGNYKVRYAAYFASGYYEEGSFGFSVQIP